MEKLIVNSAVVLVASSWLANLLPTVVPSIVAIAAVAIAARLVWFWTRSW